MVYRLDRQRIRKERAAMRKKGTVIRVLCLFFGVVVLGTVISRFTSSVLTPVVETEYASSGTIEHSIISDAVVTGSQEVPVYIPAGIRVEEICVTEGELVQEGDTLFRLNADELEETYLNKKIEHKSMKLQGSYPSEDARSLDELRIAKAEEELAYLEELVQKEGNVCAAFGGMVTEIRQQVGCAASDEAALVMGKEADQYTLKIHISDAEKNYVSTGDKATVQDGTVSATGTVTAIYKDTDGSGQYTVDVQVAGDSFQIGDSVLVNMVHTSNKYEYVIPLSAIRSDAASQYVLVAREKETLLGMELVAVKVQIKAETSNAEYAGADSDALSQKDKSIINSNKPLEAGDTVREK